MGYQITLNVLISLWTTAGDTFTFSQTYKKIWLFYHFYGILKVWQNLRVIFILKYWIEVYDIVLYVHMCSRWFIYIFMRLKHLLNITVNIARNCAYFNWKKIQPDTSNYIATSRQLFLKSNELIIFNNVKILTVVGLRSTWF